MLAFHALALKVHPDKGGAGIDFVRVSFILDVLTNAASRALYDLHGRAYFVNFPVDDDGVAEEVAEDVEEDTDHFPEEEAPKADAEFDVNPSGYQYRFAPVSASAIKQWVDLLAMRQLHHGCRTCGVHISLKGGLGRFACLTV
jgi:curved DNA-binding protein CbpA